MTPAAIQVQEAWVARYDGPGSNDDEAKAMAVDGSGNVYVTGLSWSGSGIDYATIKYNSAGQQQWVARYNGPGNFPPNDEASAVAVDSSGSVYVTGWSTGLGGGTFHRDYATIKYLQNATPTPTPTPTVTPCAAPAVTTSAATSVGSSSATLNGTVNPNGCNTTVHFQYGTTTSYGATTANQTFAGNTTRNVAANISGLAASTTYHFRIVATNSAGTRYGGDGTFTTLSPTGPPVVTTNPASYIASLSARLNGSVDPHGLTTTVHFQYGTTTSYGHTTAIQSKTGNTYQNVVANIGGFTASTTYHFRIVATNSSGTRYGSDRTFTTLSPTGPPVAITNPATNVASSSATLNGSVDTHGLTTTVHFQYGTTTSYGHTTASQSKTGNTYQNVAANISGLTAHTTYHFRVVATNSGGTRFGGDRTFTTP